MKKTLLILMLLLQFGIVIKVQAQVDPHFSQYYANPLWLNPALTGVIDGDLRFNSIFKSQWASVGNAYKTAGFSTDYRPTNQVGLGLNVINQRAGAVGYNYFAAYASFGYAVALSTEYEWLNFGVQAGMINRSVDPGKFQTDSQFDPSGGGYNPNLPINENFIASNATVFDASAGAFYHDDDPDKVANLFVGVSLAHLSRPKDPFAAEGSNYKLPIRYNFHGGVRINMSEYFALTPHAIYIKQGPNKVTVLGGYTETKFRNENILILGGMYRLNDAAIANVGYRINNLTIGASYDFNTSAFNAATNGQGGIELSVSYVFRRGALGPAPVCPRF